MEGSINHPRHDAQNHITLQKRSQILTTFERKPRALSETPNKPANRRSFVDKYPMAGFESRSEHLEGASHCAQEHPKRAFRIASQPSRKMSGVRIKEASGSAHDFPQMAFTPRPARAIHAM